MSSHRSDEIWFDVYFDRRFFMCPLKYGDETILDLRLPMSKGLSFKEMNDLLLDKTNEDIWKWFYCKPKYTLEEGIGKGKVLLDDFEIVDNGKDKVILDDAKDGLISTKSDDDFDLQLSAPLGLSNISNTSFSQTQEMDNVEEKTTRIGIPDSAGIFETDRIKNYVILKMIPHKSILGNVILTMRARMMIFKVVHGLRCLSYLKKGKLEIVVAIITSCKPNVLGDMNVTLKDPSGTTFSTIHYKVLSSEDGYAKDIKVGSAIILRNVSVFRDKSKNYALNIKIKNLVKIIKKDTVVEDADAAIIPGLLRRINTNQEIVNVHARQARRMKEMERELPMTRILTDLCHEVTDAVRDKAKVIKEAKELGVATQVSDSMA
nr:hypothetical protein [Tanacetum cinerariifolium]